MFHLSPFRPVAAPPGNPARASSSISALVLGAVWYLTCGPVSGQGKTAASKHAWNLEEAVLQQLQLYPRDAYLQYVALDSPAARAARSCWRDVSDFLRATTRASAIRTSGPPRRPLQHFQRRPGRAGIVATGHHARLSAG